MHVHAWPFTDITSISFTRVNFTCVRTEKLRNSGNQAYGGIRFLFGWHFQKNADFFSPEIISALMIQSL